MDSIPPSFDSINNTINQLKQKIRSIENSNDRFRGNNSFEPDHTILDVNFPLLKKSFIRWGINRSRYYGPTAARTVMMKSNQGTRLDEIIRGYMEKEREGWREKHNYHLDMGKLFHESPSEDRIIEELKSLVGAHKAAYIERLKIYGVLARGILPWGMFPIDALCRCLDMFHQEPDGSISFIKPKDSGIYSTLALIVAVVNLMVIIGKCEAEEKLVHRLKDTNKLMIPLAVHLLVLSKFESHPTLAALYAMVFIRYNDFVIGEEEFEFGNDFESFPIFQTIITMCYQLGIHRNPMLISNDWTDFAFVWDPTGESREEQHQMVKRSISLLWSYIVFTDSLYSCENGFPLLINNDFCDRPLVPGFQTSCMKLFREVSYEVNSTVAMSINHMIGLMDRLSEQLRAVPSFSETITRKADSNLVRKWAVDFVRKMRIIINYQRLCHSMKLSLEDLDFIPQDEAGKYLTPENLIAMSSLSKKLGIRSLLCCFLFLSLIRVSCEQQTNFGATMKKFMIIFRPDFCRMLKASCETFSITLFNRDSKLQRYVSKLQHNDGVKAWEYDAVPDLTCDLKSIEVIEKALYTNLAYVDLHDRSSVMGSKMVWDSRKLLEYLTIFYNSVSANDEFAKSYSFFIRFKYLVVLCYLIDTIIKSGLKAKDLKPGSTNWNEIVDRTKKIIDMKMKVGATTKMLDFNDEEIGSFVNSLDMSTLIWGTDDVETTKDNEYLGSGENEWKGKKSGSGEEIDRDGWMAETYQMLF